MVYPPPQQVIVCPPSQPLIVCPPPQQVVIVSPSYAVRGCCPGCTCERHTCTQRNATVTQQRYVRHNGGWREDGPAAMVSTAEHTHKHRRHGPRAHTGFLGSIFG